MTIRRLSLWVLIVLVLSAACTAAEGEEVPLTVSTDTPASATLETIPSDTAVPVFTSTPSHTATPAATPVVVLPPQPIEVQFTASDGQELSGRYFPADENPAPILVLMPWSRGNQGEWEEVAYWLQGRGLLERAMNSRETWKSSNWFPERVLDTPLGVFTFDFRSCESQEGCQAYLPAEWLLDAQAALEAAAGLEGADPEKILAVGASNGADGAVDSCVWMNTTDLGRCLGGFAMSPSSALTIDFREAAKALVAQESPVPVYCLYGLLDDAAEETCADFPEIRSISYGYTDDHGLELILVDRRPDPLDLLQEFISEALGGAG